MVHLMPQPLPPRRGRPATRPPQRAPQRAPKVAIDLLVLGALFILTGLVDLGIIAANPDYRLAVFGMRLDGFPGWVAKLQSPVMHLLLGVGFLRLRRWAFMLSLVYLSYGIMSAAVNLAVLGFGWIRIAFLLGSLGFLAYLWWRRAAFEGPRRTSVHLTLVKEERA